MPSLMIGGALTKGMEDLGNLSSTPLFVTLRNCSKDPTACLARYAPCCESQASTLAMARTAADAIICYDSSARGATGPKRSRASAERGSPSEKQSLQADAMASSTKTNGSTSTFEIVKLSSQCSFIRTRWCRTFRSCWAKRTAVSVRTLRESIKPLMGASAAPEFWGIL